MLEFYFDAADQFREVVRSRKEGECITMCTLETTPQPYYCQLPWQHWDSSHTTDGFPSREKPTYARITAEARLHIHAYLSFASLLMPFRQGPERITRWP